ncbi:hypothetical protein Pmani_036860 [Petrolisthes manimaculis]|uniref:Uncharacterized protein n=1 Tax=Petrolisthes manimaculis TaxID=1843537 RepID=A0AAE1TLR9_9EUCA|nr:hypothetical protein Pmani_036860 [Petrolisthes manimaculis]
MIRGGGGDKTIGGMRGEGREEEFQEGRREKEKEGRRSFKKEEEKKEKEGRRSFKKEEEKAMMIIDNGERKIHGILHPQNNIKRQKKTNNTHSKAAISTTTSYTTWHLLG